MFPERWKRRWQECFPQGCACLSRPRVVHWQVLQTLLLSLQNVGEGTYCFSHQCDFTPRTTSSVRSPIIYPAHSLLLILGAFWLTPTFYSSYNSLKSDRNKCPGNKTQRWETYVSLPHILPRWVTGAAAHIPKPLPSDLLWSDGVWAQVVCALLPSSWSGCQLAALLEWRAQLVSSSLLGISPSMQLPTLGINGLNWRVLFVLLKPCILQL